MVVVGVVLALGGCEEPTLIQGDSDRVERGGLALQDVLGGEEGFARALGPRELEFPGDHGSHDDFRSEWWYITANLEDREGHRFGVQFTVFRQAIAPPRPDDNGAESAWRTRQLFLAHFGLTDVREGRHRAFERAARGAMGLAGAQAAPFRVWVDGWSLASEHESFMPLRLEVRTQTGVSLDLRMIATKPMVLQGDRGFSAKSAAPGNASYYYTYTRLAVHGDLESAGERVSLSGTAWLDREWSTSVLGEAHAGWDWFALQLDDGRELMAYRLRRRDGSRDAFDRGLLVQPDGSSEQLGVEDFDLSALDFWQDERGVHWPSRWELNLPRRGLSFRIEPLVRDQLMRTTLRYWEGAVDVTGSEDGVGYMELTGYGDDR